MSIGPEHVLAAARVLRAALAPHLHRDWSVRAGDLTWSCRETLLHAADCWSELAAMKPFSPGPCPGVLPRAQRQHHCMSTPVQSPGLTRGLFRWP